MSGGNEGRLSLSLASVIARRSKMREELGEEGSLQLDWHLLEVAERGGVVSLPLMRGANPDVRDLRKLTSLMYSAVNRHTENIGALLTVGADALIEAPAIVRGHNIFSTDEAGPAQPGDMPLTAPFMSIITASLIDIQTFAEANIEIPRQWHDTFKAWATQRDELLERSGRPQRLTPMVNKLLKLTA
jgi:hypothetical protein